VQLNELDLREELDNRPHCNGRDSQEMAGYKPKRLIIDWWKSSDVKRHAHSHTDRTELLELRYFGETEPRLDFMTSCSNFICFWFGRLGYLRSGAVCHCPLPSANYRPRKLVENALTTLG
jgi:hypothetical protein